MTTKRKGIKYVTFKLVVGKKLILLLDEKKRSRQKYEQKKSKTGIANFFW